jgi:hypothetical protein
MPIAVHSCSTSTSANMLISTGPPELLLPITKYPLAGMLDPVGNVTEYSPSVITKQLKSIGVVQVL